MFSLCTLVLFGSWQENGKQDLAPDAFISSEIQCVTTHFYILQNPLGFLKFRKCHQFITQIKQLKEVGRHLLNSQMIPQVLLMCHIWRRKKQEKNQSSIHPITNSLQDCKTLKSYFAKERTKLEIIFQVTEAGISSELSFYVQLKYSFVLKILEVSLPLTSFPAKETYDRLIFRVIDWTR